MGAFAHKKLSDINKYGLHSSVPVHMALVDYLMRTWIDR